MGMFSLQEATRHKSEGCVTTCDSAFSCPVFQELTQFWEELEISACMVAHLLFKLMTRLQPSGLAWTSAYLGMRPGEC